MLGPTAHTDTFARDNLPASDLWPDLILDRPEYQYPDHINVAVELTDRNVEAGHGDRFALVGNGRKRTYRELADWSNRIARALVEDFGVEPGNRVLIRSGNNPAMVAAWLGATKAGAVVVNTMPMLRASELSKIVDKAEVELALCDTRLADEMERCASDSRFLKRVVLFDGSRNHEAELDEVALGKPTSFDAVKTGRDDVALLGFTSGTPGNRRRPCISTVMSWRLPMVTPGPFWASHRMMFLLDRHRLPSLSASVVWRSSPCVLVPPPRCWKTRHHPIWSRS